MYWSKGDDYLQSRRPHIPLPPNVLPDRELYCFHQYSYMVERIDSFRTFYKDRVSSRTPPGLSLIGTPGIGELVPTHLFS